MAVVLGILAAIAYGCADFLGGLSSRRAKVLTVVLVSQLAGTILFVVSLPFFLGDPYSGSALAWGVAAGAAGLFGVTMLFRGLSRGHMSIVAPITGTIAAGLPVVVGLISGERPSTLALVGVGVALISVILVSSADHGTDTEQEGERASGLMSRGLPEAIAAGTFFGLFFILLDQAGDAAGIWPLIGARISSVVTGIALLMSGVKLRPPKGTLRTIAGAGILDVAANLFYLLATQRGLLSLVAVLTSMYPAITVVLARFVLKEKLTRIQLIGLLLAGAGIVAIAGG